MPRDEVDIQRRAEARLALLEMEERERLAPLYDWYGGPCGCVHHDGKCKEHPGEDCGCPMGLGECRVHPRARPNQRPPAGAWGVWFISAGRGFGKTRTGAEWIRDCEANGARHIALVSETVKDVRDVMIEGPAGLIAISPPWNRPNYEPSKARVTWPSGAVATMFSAEQPDQLRGPQHDKVWVDELAKFKHRQQETWDNIELGLRLGDDPQACVTTTPRPTATVKMLLSDERTKITTGSTFDNEAHLAPTFIHRIRQKYGGTRLGEQELFAKLLGDTPGALWTAEIIDRYRHPDGIPDGIEILRVVVAIDPSAGSSDPESAAEAGIVVGALGREPISGDLHAYILEDMSIKGSPNEWATRAISGYAKHRGDRIVAEINNGGAMVETVLRGVDPSIPYKTLWASRGKVTRAEPVVALYEQGRVHHCGTMEVFAKLESQQCEWVPPEKSPDRMDALVWCVFELLLEGKFDDSLPVVADPRRPFSYY